MDELKRQAGGPMYHRLRQDLLARIRRGEFGPGDLLPSENQLCEQYGVSVTTARRAFLELVKEGVVRRKAGVGTVVAPQVRRAQLAFISIDYVGDAWRNISSVMGEMIAGVGECAWQNDATLNMVGVEDEEAAGYLRGLVEKRSADGVLLRAANDIREEHLEILEEAGIPYVVIKRRIPGRRISCVISDDESGARMATSHLLDLGHGRIGFVCAKPHITLFQERLVGYRAALEERGVDFDEELIRQEPYFTTEMGYRAVRSLLELPVPPTAIFVASDTMALGGYGAAQESGLRVPEDIAFVGYDDIAPVSVLQPPLTTVRTSYYDFGSLATQLLLDLVDGKKLAPQQRVIEPALIVRGSTEEKPQARASSVQREASIRPEPVPHGRLFGKTVLCAELDRELTRHIALAGEAEGARVLDGGASQRVAAFSRRADVLVHGLSSQRELGEILDRGRSAAEEMAGQGGGRIAYVVSATPEDSLSGAESEALRAGLAWVVREISDEWKTRGVRVNAVVSAAGAESVVGPVMFLASPEAEHLNGEVLTLSSMESQWTG